MTPPPACLIASESLQHRVTSALLDGFSAWWEMPALVLAVAVVVAAVVVVYRRDAVDLSWPVRTGLAALRLGALAAVVAAMLDIERIAEREVVVPSRVAVLVDTSASMALDDAAAATTPAASRARQAVDALENRGLLAALRERQDVAIWRFDAAAERVAVLPRLAAGAAAADDATSPAPAPTADWRDRLAPQGVETRLGDALARVLDDEPAGALAGVVVLTDGGTNGGADPRASAAALAAAEVVVHPVGIGSDVVPAGVRLADLVAPARVFPGDAFAVTAHLQPQGMAGRRVRVELSMTEQGDSARPSPAAPLATVDVVLGADGELVPVRLQVAGLTARGRQTLAVRLAAAGGDAPPATEPMTTDIEVVERVTRVLLMAGGPGREYQFMRNVLQRDDSFSVDVLLGTAAAGVSQDARRILDAFPESDEALADYDVIAAFDYDWRRLDLAARGRLERWVSRESGGLVLVAGHVFMDGWTSDPQMVPIRNLFPLELRGANQLAGDRGGAGADPQPLRFTRDGADAEFLWLAGTRGASEAVWAGFPGVYSQCPPGMAKPGATVYARVAAPGVTETDPLPVYLAGQFYGSGTVFYIGSGELWRLRGVDPAAHERLTTQLMRHVSQGRLLRGSRRGRLLVDRERYPVGAAVAVRVVVPEGSGAGRAASCRVVAPDGTSTPLSLTVEPGRADVLRGTFVAGREGLWQIRADLGDSADEPLVRQIQAQLPDRELARPRLDREVLAGVAAAAGGKAWFLHDAPCTPAAARELAASLPDRSRREYETGAPDAAFKQWLNGLLLAVAAGLLSVEWLVRRLVRLA